MKVYRISKCNYIDDLSGAGAARFSGRWHSKGTYILYTAASAALAMLESIVHITTLVKPELCIVCLDVPEEKIQTLSLAQLPNQWFVNPSPDVLKSVGDRFVKEGIYLMLKTPSAIMPEEHNYLINPAHPDFKK